MAMSDYSLSDIAAVTEGGGFGGNNGWGDGGWWILLLFILLGGNRGWGGYGGGSGSAGGNELYPWINQTETVNDGFRDQMIQTNIQGIQQGINNLSTQLCNCCGDMQMSLANGFAGVEQGANSRQMANMQQAFGLQTAMMQGFNGQQMQTANMAAQIASEACADRQAVSDGVRDIMENCNRNNQAVLDKLCQLELDGVKNQLAQAERDNLGLQNQLNMANMQASQNAQNALIQQGFSNEVDALYNRLRNCPVPSMPVYGQTPIFTCNSGGCGCGN